MRAVLMVFGLALLAACATPAGYEQKLGRWNGADEASLLRAWGTPQREAAAGGARFLTFVSIRDFHVMGNPPDSFTPTTFAGLAASMLPYPGAPGYVVRTRCETTFELRDARVASWSWQGDDCRAAEQRGARVAQ